MYLIKVSNPGFKKNSYKSLRKRYRQSNRTKRLEQVLHKRSYPNAEETYERGLNFITFSPWKHK